MEHVYDDEQFLSCETIYIPQTQLPKRYPDKESKFMKFRMTSLPLLSSTVPIYLSVTSNCWES